MQSVYITTTVVSSNPVHGEVYSIQHYVIKFVSDLQQVRRFSPGTPASATNKTYHHDITELLLKVALNTINQINLNGKKSLICNTVVITYQLEMLCYNSENSFCGPCRTTE